MTIDYFIKGLVIGFSLAIPVGPIGLLLIRRTLTRGRISGLVSGLGAATADAIYGAIAGFGLTLLSNFLVSHSLVLRLLGGAFLCYLGGKIFFSKPREKAARRTEDGLLGDYVSTLFLTLTNPLTILSFAAIFAAAGVVVVQGEPYLTAVLILGVFSGSCLWWVILGGIVSFFHGKLDTEGILILNKISGALIAVFGVMIFVSVQLWPQ
ncbi:MAG: LysE family translocator [Deltaproteobacteria bacterium]|nr:LysE family translocator [Deltaproteobacteria bacterium]